MPQSLLLGKGAVWSLILLSQINKTSAALSQSRVFSYKNVLSFFGTGDSERAAGEEIKKSNPLDPRSLSRRLELREGSSKV